MVFSSAIFLFMFLPITLIIHFLIKDKYRNIFLLIVSLGFYAWSGPKFLLVMIISIIINYTSGVIIDSLENVKLRRGAVIIAILLNLSNLFYFKYWNFSMGILYNLFNMEYTSKNIMLPLGISFFTFQGMSYIIDLYWKKNKVQKNPLKLALYIALFPKLMQGPIVRYIDIEKQIDNRKIDSDLFSSGIRKFIIGLGKKIIIANSVGVIVDSIFSLNYYQNTVATAWLGVICYAIQLYFDFSGYSDMAIGLGRMLGFHFLENFNYPYISTSITEFWRRWHISLSSWFRDYLYIPLGGNRKGNVYVNLMIVFLATGVWHGAAWNFILWGIWHGIFIVIERIIKKMEIRTIKIPEFLSWLYTMFIVLIGWVLFRSPNISYAIGYIKLMFGLVELQNVGFNVKWYLDNYNMFTICIGFIASTPIVHIIQRNTKTFFTENINLCIKNISSIILLIICIMLVVTSTYNSFIYFKF